MVVVDMNLIPPKVNEKKTSLWVNFFLGHQKIYTQKVPKHLKKGGVKGNKERYECGRKKCAL